MRREGRINQDCLPNRSLTFYLTFYFLYLALSYDDKYIYISISHPLNFNTFHIMTNKIIYNFVNVVLLSYNIA